MSHDILDFRSDTATRPTPGMRAAMAEAPVGDDVFGEDPTVNQLEERTAAMLGKEAAIFVPTGTMSNQIGVRLHCSPGDEFICEGGCHIYNYEQGAFAQLSGLAARTVDGPGGILRVEQLRGLIRPENDHLVRTRLVCLENTHNRGAGRIQPYDTVAEICDWAHGAGLTTHLDGARLWNAAIASGIKLSTWAKMFDTVSVCFSKGLGAPVGSALCGPKDLIRMARRHRKLFGGGMRQAGVIAAGALYALDNHLERLADDHENARRLGDGIRSIPGLELRPDEIDTNIVIFAVSPELGTAAEFCAKLKREGLLMLSISPTTCRAVTHLDVDAADVERAIEIMAAAAGQSPETQPVAADSSLRYGG